MATQEITERNDKGQFLPGVSGNALGRPKSRKNKITEMKQDLEIALRENVAVDAVKGIIDKMVKEATKGNVGAAKLILDKVLSNAKVEDDSIEAGGGITIRIENATFKAEGEVKGEVIESTAEEIPNEHRCEEREPEPIRPVGRRKHSGRSKKSPKARARKGDS